MNQTAYAMPANPAGLLSSRTEAHTRSAAGTTLHKLQVENLHKRYGDN